MNIERKTFAIICNGLLLLMLWVFLIFAIVCSSVSTCMMAHWHMISFQMMIHQTVVPCQLDIFHQSTKTGRRNEVDSLQINFSRGQHFVVLMVSSRNIFCLFFSRQGIELSPLLNFLPYCCWCLVEDKSILKYKLHNNRKVQRPTNLLFLFPQKQINLHYNFHHWKG